ncbi:MAG: hypothetical protein IJ520_08295 [Synergistaceae bacterium]|nr:hypothetical protein [Synergistaceae bacterium]MBR1604081.1 hypothetical protein [Synergistaceae bacterium]
MLENLKARFAFSKRKRLLKRLREAVEHDRTESARRQILKIQMRGFSPEFLNYIP